MADVAILRGKQTEALPYLRTAVEKNPKNAAAADAMGRYLAEQKNYAAAEAALQKCVVLDPQWTEGQLSLGDFYFSRQRFKEATAAYRAAVRTNPNSGLAHFSLGMALENGGDNGAAETEFKTASQVTPQVAGPHIALANLLARTGKDDAAIVRKFENASKLAPHSGEPLCGYWNGAAT